MQDIGKKFGLKINRKSYIIDIRVICFVRKVVSIILIFPIVEVLNLSDFFKQSLNVIGLIILVLAIFKYIIYDRNYLILHSYSEGYRFKLKSVEKFDYSINEIKNPNEFNNNIVIYPINKDKGLIKSFTTTSSEKNTVLLYNFYEFTEKQLYEFNEHQDYFYNIINVYKDNFMKKIIIINNIELSDKEEIKNIDTKDPFLIIYKKRYKVINNVNPFTKK